MVAKIYQKCGNSGFWLLCLSKTHAFALFGGKMADPLGQGEIALRVGAALLAGLALGFEREGHGRAAGLKTMILACVSSCLAMILSEVFFLENLARAAGGTTGFLPDRSRLAAGILTGIGFLGAGAILRHGNSIRGVTTGAVLWYSTIVGMAYGTGHFWIASLGVAIALAVLYLIPVIESRVARDEYARLILTLDLIPIEDETFVSILRAKNIVVTELRRSIDKPASEQSLDFQLKYRVERGKDLSGPVLAEISALPGIRSVRWE